jgi:hypothetical protein
MTSSFRRRLLKSAGALASAEFSEPGEKSGTFLADAAGLERLPLLGTDITTPITSGRPEPLFRELNLPIDYTINYDEISLRLLRPYRLFLVLRDGMIWP